MSFLTSLLQSFSFTENRFHYWYKALLVCCVLFDARTCLVHRVVTLVSRCHCVWTLTRYILYFFPRHDLTVVVKS